jgi:hypothetical protein
MRRVLLFAVLLFTAPLISQSAPRVDRMELMRDVTMLASPGFEGRLAGRPGGAKARQFLTLPYPAIRTYRTRADRHERVRADLQLR